MTSGSIALFIIIGGITLIGVYASHKADKYNEDLRIHGLSRPFSKIELLPSEEYSQRIMDWDRVYKRIKAGEKIAETDPDYKFYKEMC